ncbi:TM2 domain-containing protein [Nesterenkonia xinjiangensis]|uniref:TM2 domain-containing membrane protein YozV n=1 Tax=Nesterenkonia xinjiangensis TaxID=225327 RepID=A0A7Z0GP05_9MICC|nr:TM2 domain-containing protein [Nesterenkonia xinjiangensis]NYJ79029.1 TM2 domain-containing membrane protein YozV [Nesterenkonia xinjiangensis]
MGEMHDLDDLYANTYTEEDRRAFESQPTSEKKFLIAWALALVLGPLGAQRYYLGRIPTGVVKSLMFGTAMVGFATGALNLGFIFMGVVGAWTIIDLFLLLSGTMSDRKDVRLDGFRRWAGPCAAITVLVLVGFLIAALVIGTSSAVSP